jgi:peptide/nickel transport system substrate-binding protein
LVKNKDGDIKEYNLIANDDYYFKKPFIKNFKFKFFVNYTEAIKALNDNQINGLSHLPLSERSELVTRDSLFFHELIRPQVFGLFFNQDKNKSLGDKNIRAAFSSAIDKQGLINNVFDGLYNREDGPILKSNYAYNSDVVSLDYNVEEATNGLKGKIASTTITVVDASRNVAVAETIKNFWETAGVNVDLTIIPGERAAEVIRNRDFEIIVYGQAVGADPDVYPFWHSSQSKLGGLNISGYNNSEADKLLSEGRELTNINERITRYHKFQENIAANVPAIFLYSPTYTYVQSKKVRGFVASAIVEPADRFAGITDWYVKTRLKLTW